MELAFAALHQLCAPTARPARAASGSAARGARDHVRTWCRRGSGPVPRRPGGVEPALGGRGGAAAVVRGRRRAMVGPRLGAGVAFVARRLLAESVVMVFAAREPSDLYAGLPELVVEGCWGRRCPGASGVGDSRAAGRAGGRPARGRDERQSVGVAGAAARPLAGATGGRVRVAGRAVAAGPIEESFLKRLAALPEDTQRLVLVAAAEPIGDPALVVARGRAGSGSPARCSTPAESAAPDRGRQPGCGFVIRSCARRSTGRRRHRSAGRCTGRWPRRPTRRSTPTGAPGIWPRLRPAPTRTSPSSSSGRPVAPRRGAVSPPPLRFSSARPRSHPNPRARAQRALAAAQTKYEAGALDDALALLATAEAGAVDDLRRARVHLLRAQIAFASRRGSDAPPLLLRAARELEAVDPDQARATYLEAFSAAMFAGRLARGGREAELSEAVLAGPPPPQPPASARSPPSGVGGPVHRGVRGGRADPEGGAPRFRAARPSCRLRRHVGSGLRAGSRWISGTTRRGRCSRRGNSTSSGRRGR